MADGDPLEYEDFGLNLSAAASFAEDGRIRCLGPTVSRPFGRMKIADEGSATFDRFKFWADPDAQSGGVVGNLATDPASVTQADITRLGRDLADLGFPHGRVRELFREALRWLERTDGAGLRLRLQIEEPSLADLPWEFVSFEEEGFNFLAHDRRISIARTNVTKAAPPAPYRRREDRRSIAFTGVVAPTTGNRPLDVAKDLEAARVALEQLRPGDVSPRWFGESNAPARWEDVSEALTAETDIFHFVGHGDFLPGAGGGGRSVLVFEERGSDSNPRPEDPVDARHVATALKNAGVRLAVLGACDSARPAAGNPWNGAATALTQLGVPAVVGNQFPILDESARLVATKLYLGVLKHQPADQPIAEARARMAALPRLGFDWGIPVLYLDNGNGVLFPDVSDGLAEALGPIASMNSIEAERRALLHSPYRGVAAFGREHAGAFFGREDVRDDILAALGADGRVVALFGPQGSGKTSLLEAGIAFAWEGTTVRITDYLRLPEAVRGALAERGMSVGEGDLTDAVSRAGQEGLLLVFDQFEALFALDPAGRDRVDRELRGLLENLSPSVSIVFSFSEQAHAHFERWRSSYGFEVHPVRLSRLSRAQARAALVGPLDLLSPPGEIDDDLVDEILAQLDDLQPGEPDSIEPTELQVVAESIFNAARQRVTERGAPIRIGRQDFIGASVIISRYLDHQLKTYFVDDEDDARDLLSRVALERGPGWIPLDDLNLTVQRLVASGFLTLRRREQTEYAFSRPAVSDVVERWMDPTVRETKLAHELLAGLIAGWEMADRTIPASTLGGLSSVADRLRCRPNEALLLLRSAVAENQDAGRWLDMTAEVAGPLIRPLESGDNAPTVDPGLVGLPRDKEPEALALSTTAATGRDRTDRRTAALALTTVNGSDERLEEAVLQIPGRWARAKRHAELWATITDAAPARQPPSASPVRHLHIWLTRAGRRGLRAAGLVGSLALAAAFGGGAALGLYRGAICAAQCPSSNIGFAPGNHFGTNLAWGGLIVLVTVAAVALVHAVRRKGPAVPATVGAAAFGGAMVAVAIISGYSYDQFPLVVPAAFVAGVPIAVAIAIRIASVRAFLAAAVAVMAVWAGTQATLSLTGDYRCDFPQCERAASLPIVESALFFTDDRQDVTSTHVTMSALDSAVTGLLLFGGAFAGQLARTRYRSVAYPGQEA